MYLKYTDNQIHEILKFNFRFTSSLQSLEKWNGRLVRTPIQCDLKSHSINMRYLRDSPHGDSVGLQDETRRLLRQPISTPTRFRTSMSNTQHQSCRYQTTVKHDSLDICKMEIASLITPLPRNGSSSYLGAIFVSKYFICLASFQCIQSLVFITLTYIFQQQNLFI